MTWRELNRPARETLEGETPEPEERVLDDPPIRIRRMRAEDVPSVVRIERDAFSTPWHAETFLSLIGSRGTELQVCESPTGEVVAYAVVSIVLDQAELANIAVRKEERGKGIGAAFLDVLLERVREKGIRELFLEVRESNTAARTLYGTRGFEAVGRRRNYYRSPREDALQLMKRFEIG